MNVRIQPAAEADVRAGFRFYERQQTGVGEHFLDSIHADVDSLQLFAGIHPKRGKLHRFRSKRFPFWIYYRIDCETAFVVAVLDARRSPQRIRQRENLENDI